MWPGVIITVGVEQILYFVVASVLLIIIPGPNVMTIVGTSLAHGPIRGLQTVAGTSAAMVVQLTVAAVSTAGLINLLAAGFIVLKWLGVLYLLYLGASHLRKALKPSNEILTLSASGSFTQGFFVSLTNPKTIVFFAAFLPQFISPVTAPLPQLFILSAIFFILALVLDTCYAMLAGKLHRRLLSSGMQRISHTISAIVYLLASAFLAFTKRVWCTRLDANIKRFYQRCLNCQFKALSPDRNCSNWRLLSPRWGMLFR